MLNAEDFDGDTEMAIAVNKEVIDRDIQFVLSGHGVCYCTNYLICAPCAKNY